MDSLDSLALKRTTGSSRRSIKRSKSATMRSWFFASRAGDGMWQASDEQAARCKRNEISPPS